MARTMFVLQRLATSHLYLKNRKELIVNEFEHTNPQIDTKVSI